MKKLLFIFVALVVVVCAQPVRDPYTPHDQFNNGNAYGKNKPPIVPEPSTYGAIFIGSTVAWVVGRRYLKNKSL